MPLPRVVLVTGANTGIGYEIVKSFLESARAYHVLLGSRDFDKGKEAVAALQTEVETSMNTAEAIQLDLNSDASIESAFEKIKSTLGRLDYLINNAGATFDTDYVAGKVSLRECFNKSYDVNVSGTNVVTHTFAPLLLKSSDPRLIFIAGLSRISVASVKYFPTPPLPAGWPKKVDFETIGYRCSKSALNMLMLDWNHKLKEDGVKVWAVGPGFLATNLGGMRDKVLAMGGGHPSIGGQMVKEVAEGARDEDVGKIVGKDDEGNFTLIPF